MFEKWRGEQIARSEYKNKLFISINKLNRARNSLPKREKIKEKSFKTVD